MSPTRLMENEAPDTWNWLELAQAGDSDAFCELCRAYETRLLRQALTLCGNASLAEDRQLLNWSLDPSATGQWSPQQ